MGVFATGAALTVALDSEPPFTGAVTWTGYVLASDVPARALRRRSILSSRPDAFVWLAVLSIFLWLPFEWFNQRLGLWYRAGQPAGIGRQLVLGWSFACVWPALFETAALLAPALPADRKRDARRPARSARVRHCASLLGACCLGLPLVAPRLDFGEHLGALAAVGFLLLLDPLNLAAGRASLWRDWASGNRSRAVAFALAGGACGLTAETLNHWASAKRHSISALGAGWKLLEFPAWTCMVWPLFGLQAFAMHVFAAGALGLPVPRIARARWRPARDPAPRSGV